MKKIVLILILPLLGINCSKEEICNILEQADLISEIAIPVTTVFAGQTGSAVNKVINSAYVAFDCENVSTESAPPSISQFEIYYRENEDSNWEVLPDYANLILQIQELVAGEPDEQEVGYTFHRPGKYQWRTSADFSEIIEERDEGNNYSEVSALVSSSNNIAYSEVLTVLPDPSIEVDLTKPYVEIISIKRIN